MCIGFQNQATKINWIDFIKLVAFYISICMFHDTWCFFSLVFLHISNGPITNFFSVKIVSNQKMAPEIFYMCLKASISIWIRNLSFIFVHKQENYNDSHCNCVCVGWVHNVKIQFGLTLVCIFNIIYLEHSLDEKKNSPILLLSELWTFFLFVCLTNDTILSLLPFIFWI